MSSKGRGRPKKNAEADATAAATAAAAAAAEPAAGSAKAAEASNNDLALAKRARRQTENSDDKYPTDQRFYHLLLRTTVDKFYEPNATIFVADRTDKVEDVWKGLVKHGFLSVPVLQKTGHKYYGCMDLADIVQYVVNKFNKESLRGETKFWEQMTEANAFHNVVVDDIMKYPYQKRNPFHPVRKGYTMMYACELLARESELHRLPVIDSNDQLFNFITQSKLVEFVNSNRDLIGDKLNKPLRECPRLFKKVITVSKASTALDAFNTMIEHHISGVAVVNDKNELIGGLSVRDLKVLGTTLQSFWRMYGTTESFINHLRSEAEVRLGRREVFYLLPSDTIGSALQQLAENKVHRFFIVESQKKMTLTGIVSLKDIISEVLGF